MQLGWSGVELFYVISGFLITGILLRSRAGPRYLRTFYLRRGLRIFPIYWLVLILAFAITVGGKYAAQVSSLPFYFVYAQNYYPQIASGFTAGIPDLAHTWTLAIEEQFYWLWPLAILAFTGKRLAALIAVLFVSAPIARVLLLQWTGNPFAVLASGPSQADSLAVGAAIAVLVHHDVREGTLRSFGVAAFLVGGASTAALVIRSGLPAFVRTVDWAADPMNALLFSALALLFGGLLALTLTSTGPLVRILSLPPLRWSGKISYGLYLYGPFADLAVRLVAHLVGIDDTLPLPGLTGAFMSGAYLVAAYLFAIVSWRYVEAPLLRLKTRLAPESPRDAVRISEPVAVGA